MIGILIQLAVSWLLIWLFERGNLRVLGLFPTTNRLRNFIVFFLVTSFLCATGFFLKMYFTDMRWVLNPALTAALVAEGLWWNIKSVLFEELIFRGVLLYILIKKTGCNWAIIISAVAFGIYHWFSFGVIGNPVQMVIVFLITGAMGLVLAYGYAKTKSLYVPIAIHLGWNFTQMFIFSDGPIGNGIFIQAEPVPFRTDSYFIFITVIFLPLLSALVVNYFLLRVKVKSQ